MDMPSLPCSFADFPARLEAARTVDDVRKIVGPFASYETQLRQVFAQSPNHPAIAQNHLVPVYGNTVSPLTIKARDLSTESKVEQDTYLLPLSPSQRRKQGSNALTPTFREFKKNFDIFAESSLSDLKWDNVVAAGSSVVTALLPVDAPHNESKRALRSYYHEHLAPASDVDLFIYGLNEEQAVEKIKQIENDVRDAVLSETTVVRTKNAITIVSEYPIRHIQIVLRLYKSVSEILTGFDVDCACVAYDGKQVWAAPRALAAFATQMNNIDLTRRSPSYENRLSKYAHRGFEVYWPLLKRTRIDPTIFERAFNRVHGLARLLVLEKLPHPQDRDEYHTKRRAERGRPALPWNARFRHQLPGNVKDAQPDDVAEWVEEDDISSYNTFTIPYGPRYTPKKVERLLFQQDLLKNAEWNKPKDRETNLHRHPAFFGRVEDILGDCCGYCPKPVTDADLAAWEEESKVFVSGNISFLKDDPGRQSIGSFHPITDVDWTEMAYIGTTTRLCQAIVDKDLEGVLDWFEGEDAGANRRDHTGRTPLQLAVMCSTPEIVQCLIDRGARIVARLYNGLTALHLAAWRGSPEIVKSLLDKSAENETQEIAKEEKRKQARRVAAKDAGYMDDKMTPIENELGGPSEAPEDDVTDDNSDADSEDRMTGSFVKIAPSEPDVEDGNDDDPDVYDVDVLAWDSPCSALHLAIMAGHLDVIRLLVETYGADVMLPVKLMTNSVPREPRGAILSLLLPLDLPDKKFTETVETLLGLGASPVQGDMNQVTALHHMVNQAKTQILRAFSAASRTATATAINHLVVKHSWQSVTVGSPLLSAIRSGSPATVREVLNMGAKPQISHDDFARAAKSIKECSQYDSTEILKMYQRSVTQPIVEAARHESMIDIVIELAKLGADINTLSARSWALLQDPNHRYNTEHNSVLDLVREHRKKLQKFAEEGKVTQNEPLKQVEQLKTDEEYLSGLTPGTYQYWSVSRNIQTARYIQKKRARIFQEDFDRKAPTHEEPGMAEKREAAASLARKYKTVENRLSEDGAKTFYEMYPKLREETSEYSHGEHKQPIYHEEQYAWHPKIVFSGADITPSNRERYIQLFEAAFAGDTDMVKELCISTSDEARPLQITVSDGSGFDPFSLALLQGHHNLASTILDIAAAQYEDKEETRKLYYTLDAEDEDEAGSDMDDTSGTNSDAGRPRIYARLVDDNFTIANIAALSKDVKSNIKPTHLLNRQSELWRVFEGSRQHAVKQLRALQSFTPINAYYWYNPKTPWTQFHACMEDERRRTSSSLWTYAITSNNLTLLEFLLEHELKYTAGDPEELLKSLHNRKNELTQAMNLGHLEMVDTLIRYRGTLLPLHHLTEQSGIVVEEIPKYYQGLSVYGQKRKDWAAQGRNAETMDKSETSSPLLDAVLEGTLDIIDFFLSDMPARRYAEFCTRFKTDKRIRALAKSRGGMGAVLDFWMSTHTNLVLHIAVMSWPAGAVSRLKYLLRRVPPEYLESRSADGDTPLHLALKLGNLPAFEALLATGANQRTRDRKGRNLLHTIYSNASSKNVALFKKRVYMIDSGTIHILLFERCAGTEPGSLTPLALYLHSQRSDNGEDLKLLDAMLAISGSKDLAVMDGAGDYPLHVEVRKQHRIKAEYLARHRPDLLYLENAAGMTPIQVAETQYLQNRFEAGSSLSGQSPRSLLDKQPSEFVEKIEGDTKHDEDAVDEDDNLPVTHPLYANLVRIARRNPQTRSLVSVLDANEVARRLAAQQRRKHAANRQREAQGLKTFRRYHRYYSRNDEVDSDDGESQSNGREDEVTKWLGIGQGRINRVPFMCHCEDTLEAVEAELSKWREFAEGKVKVLRCCERADSEDPLERRGHRKMMSEIEKPV